MRVVFLLGAGISMDVLPRSRRLSAIVNEGGDSESGDRVVRHTDSSYFLSSTAEAFTFGASTVDQVLRFFACLRRRLSTDSQDYESQYYAVQQLHDFVYGEMENPLLEPFVNEVCAAFPECEEIDYDRRLGLGSLSREALNYIGGVVASALVPRQPESELDIALRRAHRPLLAACADGRVTAIDIVTLNHDVLLERSLRSARLPFEDGFRASRSPFEFYGAGGANVDFWRGFTWRRSARIRLNKLHGSVDWWRVRPKGSDWSRDRVMRVSTCPQRLRDARGRFWNPLDERPLMLAGTLNKLTDYTTPIHLDRYAVMRRALLRADGLVVSGYSFRDKGVNGLIADWYYRRRGRGIAVVSPDLVGGAPPPDARNAIAGKWPNWLASGRLKPLPSRFSDVDWGILWAHLAAGVKPAPGGQG